MDRRDRHRRSAIALSQRDAQGQGLDPARDRERVVMIKPLRDKSMPAFDGHRQLPMACRTDFAPGHRAPVEVFEIRTLLTRTLAALPLHGAKTPFPS